MGRGRWADTDPRRHCDPADRGATALSRGQQTGVVVWSHVGALSTDIGRCSRMSLRRFDIESESRVFDWVTEAELAQLGSISYRTLRVRDTYSDRRVTTAAGATVWLSWSRLDGLGRVGLAPYSVIITLIREAPASTSSSEGGRTPAAVARTHGPEFAHLPARCEICRPPKLHRPPGRGVPCSRQPADRACCGFCRERRHSPGRPFFRPTQCVTVQPHLITPQA